MANNKLTTHQKLMENRPAGIVMGLVLLAGAYVVGSLALDTGRLMLYFLTLLLFIACLHLLARTVKPYGRQ